MEPKNLGLPPDAAGSGKEPGARWSASDSNGEPPPPVSSLDGKSHKDRQNEATPRSVSTPKLASDVLQGTTALSRQSSFSLPSFNKTDYF